MYNSTYVAEYVSDTQCVLLTDVVSQVDVLAMEFKAFRRMNRMIFGDAVSQKVETAVCGYERVVINWDKKRVAVQKPKVDLVNDFMQRALHPDTIEERTLIANDVLEGDLREYDRALLGMSSSANLRSLM